MTTPDAPARSVGDDSAGDDSAAREVDATPSWTARVGAAAVGGRALAGLLVAQAAWLLLLLGRGWYYQADISNLSEAADHRLTWGYLTDELGGHLSVVGRLQYWVLHRVAPMDYAVTVGWRILLQLLATWLLYRLLTRLVGPRPLVFAVTAAYAVSPVVGPNLAYLTPALGGTLGQLAAIGMYGALTRWAQSRRWAWALATGLAGAAVSVTDDQMTVLLLTLPILVVGFLSTGSPGRRIRRELRAVGSWLLIAAPTGAYVAAYLLGGYGGGHGTGAQHLGLSGALDLLRDVWLKGVGPLFVGGPVRWLSFPENYVPFAGPGNAVVLLGQLVFVALVVVGARRVGWASLLAWAQLMVVAGAGILLVGAGRYAAYGSTLPITWRYLFPVAVPFALAVTLALAPSQVPVPAAAVPPPEPKPEAQPEDADEPRHLALAAGVLAAAVAVVSVWSSLGFVQQWWQNPGKDYTATLVASARAAGPDTVVYDSAIRGDLISPIEPDHHISDLLRLEGVPLRYDSPGRTPLVATGDGRLTTAVFVAAGRGTGPMNPQCGTYVHGAGRTVIPLTPTVRLAEWYLQFSLYQSAPSTVSISVVDADGTVRTPVRGPTQHLPTLANLSLLLPSMAPQSVVVTSADPATSLCLVSTQVGAPFPAGR